MDYSFKSHLLRVQLQIEEFNHADDYNVAHCVFVTCGMSKTKNRLFDRMPGVSQNSTDLWFKYFEFVNEAIIVLYIVALKNFAQKMFCLD